MSPYEQGCEAARKWWTGARIITRHQGPPTNPHEPGTRDFDAWHKGYSATMAGYQASQP